MTPALPSVASGPRSPWTEPLPLRSFAAPSLILLAALVFGSSLSGAHELFQRDIHSLWRGQTESFASVVRSGSLPLWNPHIAFGRPMLADPGYQVLYPWTWVYLVLPLSYGFTLYSWLHVALCGLGVRRLGLLAGLSPLGAFGAGCAAVLSGPLLSFVNLTFQLAGAAWLPWTLVAALRVWRESDRASVLRLGLILTLQVLAGSGEMVVAAGTAIGVGAVTGLARRGWRYSGRGLGALGAGLVLGGALSAAQWLPTLSLLGQSARHTLDAHALGAWSLHPARLVELAVPSLLAEAPLRPEARNEYFNGREPFLNSVHTGAAVLALGLVGLVRGGGLALAAAGGCAVFILAALGPHTPLGSLMAAGPLGLFRFPEKWLLPATLAIALLCGAGLDVLGTAWNGVQRRRARLAMGALVAAGFLLGAAPLLGSGWWATIAEGGLDAARLRFLGPVMALWVMAWIVRRRIVEPALGLRWPAIALALALLSTFDAARAVNRTTPAAILSFVPRAAHLLKPTGVARLQARPPADKEMRAILARQGLDIEPVAALARMEALSSPVSASFGIDGAYDADVTGLGLPEHTLLSSAAVQYAGSPLAERLLRLGAVTHVLAPDAGDFPGFATLAAVPWIGQDPLLLLRVPAPRPRVLVVHRTRVVGNAKEAVPRLGDPALDITRETLVVGGPEIEGEGADSTCVVTARAADSLDLKCSLTKKGVVVIAEAWDPGWRATVDGADAPVLRADVLFRGIEVAAGTHEVRLRYRPGPVIAGGLISLAAMLLVAALALTRTAPTPA